MTVQVTLNSDAIKTVKETFKGAPKEVAKAASAAVNRTALSLRKEASVTVRKHYVIAAGTVKKTFTIKRANAKSISGAVISKGTVLDLSKFRLRKPKRGPVKVQVRKDGRLKPVHGLFIHEGRKPMQRTSAAAYPLRVPQGPSVPQMFGNEETLKELAPIAEETLNKRFLHEINYRFGKALNNALR